jgi:hypothetical protein
VEPSNGKHELQSNLIKMEQIDFKEKVDIDELVLPSELAILTEILQFMKKK